MAVPERLVTRHFGNSIVIRTLVTDYVWRRLALGEQKQASNQNRSAQHQQNPLFQKRRLRVLKAHIIRNSRYVRIHGDLWRTAWLSVAAGPALELSWRSRPASIGGQPQENPALRRERLAWVSQNFIWPETIAAANARIVSAHAVLPLAGLRRFCPVVHRGDQARETFFGGSPAHTRQFIGYHEQRISDVVLPRIGRLPRSGFGTRFAKTPHR